MEFWENVANYITKFTKGILFKMKNRTYFTEKFVNKKPKIHFQEFMESLNEREKGDVKEAIRVLDFLRNYSSFRYPDKFYIEKLKALYKINPEKIFNDLKRVQTLIEEAKEKVENIYEEEDKKLIYLEEMSIILGNKGIHPLARLFAITLGLQDEHSTDLINEAIYQSINNFQLMKRANDYIKFEIRRINRRVNEIKTKVLKNRELIGAKK